jgi:protocadherin-16/23
MQLSELAQLNAEMPLPSASDADSPPFSVQAYRIASGNMNNAFRLSTKRLNGVLYVDLVVNGEVDREFRDNYLLTVEAVDGGEPPLTATLLVNVTIVDANDNAPVFNQPRYLAQVQQVVQCSRLS